MTLPIACPCVFFLFQVPLPSIRDPQGGRGQCKGGKGDQHQVGAESQAETPCKEWQGECQHPVVIREAPAGVSAHGTGVGAVCRQPLGTFLLIFQQCDLTGWWENELGSKMHVDAVDSQGNFTGEYHTAVSSAQKPIEPSPLLGSQHLDEDGQCTFGFTVNWKFSGQ